MNLFNAHYQVAQPDDSYWVLSVYVVFVKH